MKQVSKIQNASKGTKRVRFHVPEPQRERIIKKFISGIGVRQISREENRTRSAVSRIVHSSEVQKYVSDMRSAYYALGPDALDGLRRALRTSNDGKLAYQLLRDIGVVANTPPNPIPSMGSYSEEEEERQVQICMGKLVQVAAHRASVYGISLGQIEDDLKAAGGKIDRTTGRIVGIETSKTDQRLCNK